MPLQHVLAVVVRDADVVPMLPDDVWTVSEFGANRAGGDKHSDSDGDAY
jgi:hypothetical protein